MIEKFTLLFLSLLIILAGCASGVYMRKDIGEREIKKVVVLSFSDKTARIARIPIRQWGSLLDGEILADLFTAEVVRQGKFEVIERSQILKVAPELKPPNKEGTLLDVNAATEIGRLVGADGVFIGSFAIGNIKKRRTGLRGVISFTVRLVEVKTGSVVISGSKTVKGRFAVPFEFAKKGLREIARQIGKAEAEGEAREAEMREEEMPEE